MTVQEKESVHTLSLILRNNYTSLDSEVVCVCAGNLNRKSGKPYVTKKGSFDIVICDSDNNDDESKIRFNRTNIGKKIREILGFSIEYSEEKQKEHPGFYGKPIVGLIHNHSRGTQFTTKSKQRYSADFWSFFYYSCVQEIFIDSDEIYVLKKCGDFSAIDKERGKYRPLYRKAIDVFDDVQKEYTSSDAYEKKNLQVHEEYDMNADKEGITEEQRERYRKSLRKFYFETFREILALFCAEYNKQTGLSINIKLEVCEGLKDCNLMVNS